MPFSDIYRRQVQLLVRILPLVAQEECFVGRSLCPPRVGKAGYAGKAHYRL